MLYLLFCVDAWSVRRVPLVQSILNGRRLLADMLCSAAPTLHPSPASHPFTPHSALRASAFSLHLSPHAYILSHTHVYLHSRTQVAFPFELEAASAERDAALAREAEALAARDASARELADLNAHMAEFVKGNIDHMLAWRELQQKAAGIQAELDVATSANAALNAAAAEAAVREQRLKARAQRLTAPCCVMPPQP